MEPQRLKMQKIWLNQSSNYLQYHSISTAVNKVIPLENPLDSHRYEVHLSLIEDVKKKTRSPEELRQITLTTINERFPEEIWLHVYTDESLLDKVGCAGAGVFSSCLLYTSRCV